MTKKERILAAARGEMPDMLPYAPRFDLWYNANAYTGTLPERHRGRTPEEIARAEGWAIHKVIPELLKVASPEDNVHRCLGLYSLRENGFRVRLGKDVETRVTVTGDEKRIEYHTPLGVVSALETVTEEMRRAGASITWMRERPIKSPRDYAILAHIYAGVEIVPDYERYRAWQEEVGEDGVATMMGTFSASPMQHIQRDLLEATEFFFHYKDHAREMAPLAEAIGHVYEQILRVVCDSPAEVVLWGSNYDDMITYPPYFEKELSPWLRRASAALAEKGKLLLSHTDGENQGLMDIIPASGIRVAEALCPAPMTKVGLEEYYRRWCDRLTIFGGIPQSILLPETASDEDFAAYVDHFLTAVAPGRRIIAGVADTTPPNADFDRLVRLGDRIEKEGRLPLQAGAFRPLPVHMLKVQAGPSPAQAFAGVLPEAAYLPLQDAVLAGDVEGALDRVRELLSQGLDARDILKKGMISAMEVIGGRFKTGEVFIPEVLLSARAMNEALLLLEPHLAAGGAEAQGKVVIGTVRGDLHDIGKNLVAVMLRGVGLNIIDLGINVSEEAFVAAVEKHGAQVLAMSALLTTTMPEMRKTVEILTEKGLREKVRVIVGGAPVNDKFAHDIGADGYAPDGGSAVVLVKRLLAKA